MYSKFGKLKAAVLGGALALGKQATTGVDGHGQLALTENGGGRVVGEGRRGRAGQPQTEAHSETECFDEGVHDRSRLHGSCLAGRV